MYPDETEKAAEGRSNRLGATVGVAGGLRARIAEQMNQCASESLRSRTERKAQETAYDSARHERLAERLTPEVESLLWVLQECIALGLVDLEQAFKSAAARRAELGRTRY